MALALLIVVFQGQNTQKFDLDDINIMVMELMRDKG